MPLEVLRVRPSVGGVGNMNPSARQSLLQIVVTATVVPEVAQSPADPKAEVRSHGHESLVEQTMEIAAKEDAVRKGMLAALGVRPDVGRLEDGKRMLRRDGALATVSVEDGEPEAPLSQARSDLRGRAESIPTREVGDRTNLGSQGPEPYRRAFFLAVAEAEGSRSVAVSFRRLLPIQS